MKLNFLELVYKIEINLEMKYSIKVQKKYLKGHIWNAI